MFALVITKMNYFKIQNEQERREKNHMNFSMAEPSLLGIVCGQRMKMMMKMIGK